MIHIVDNIENLPMPGNVYTAYLMDSLKVGFTWSASANVYKPMHRDHLASVLLLEEFTKVYNKTGGSVPYNMRWSDGKGGHPHAVRGAAAPIVPVGEMRISISPGMRRIIFIGTPLGNVVVYDKLHYLNSPVLKNYVMYDGPQELHDVLDLYPPQDTMTKEVFDDFFGTDRPNIGTYHVNVYSVLHRLGNRVRA